MSENYCYNCRYYLPYYIKGSVRFEKLKYGMCHKSKNTVEPRNGCEKYSHRFRLGIDPNLTAIKAVEEHVNLLAELKQILEENDQEALEAFILEKRLKKERQLARLEKANKFPEDDEEEESTAEEGVNAAAEK